MPSFGSLVKVALVDGPFAAFVGAHHDAFLERKLDGNFYKFLPSELRKGLYRFGEFCKGFISFRWVFKGLTQNVKSFSCHFNLSVYDIFTAIIECRFRIKSRFIY